MKILKIFTVLFVILIANNIYAQTVSIDETFGDNGFVIVPENEYNPGVITNLKYDNNGNIVAVGVIAGNLYAPIILKTNADGIIDKNFGTNGMVTLSGYLMGPQSSQIYDVKITNENKILLFLLSSIINKPIIIRLNENGTVDKSFGNNGEVILDVDYILTINTENNDFMYIASYSDNVGAWISKYNYNGVIDTNFGIKGKAYLTDNATFKIFPNSIKILNDGSIFVVGYDSFNSFAKLAFCKLNQQGNLVTDFANNGKWIMDMGNYYRKQFYNAIETNSGNLVLTGEIVSNRFICSFNSNGTINQNFGENGFFYYGDLSNGYKQTLFQNGDKYLISEWKQIVSINENGTLDTQFNNGGFCVFEDFRFTNDMLFQSPNKIIIGGQDSYYINFTMTRLNISSDVSIKDIHSDESSIIFPNPAKDILYFKTEKQFEIFDIQGKILLKSDKTANSVNINHLKAGIYFIKFDNSKIEKFIKN